VIAIAIIPVLQIVVVTPLVTILADSGSNSCGDNISYDGYGVVLVVVFIMVLAATAGSMVAVAAVVVAEWQWQYYL
jgi:hypothetical protein